MIPIDDIKRYIEEELPKIENDSMLHKIYCMILRDERRLYQQIRARALAQKHKQMNLFKTHG